MLRSVLAASLLVFFFIAEEISALPYHKRDPEIPPALTKRLEEVPELKDTNLILDDTANVIYVSPSHRSTQAGAYADTGAAQCDGLRNLYDMIYSVPPRAKMLEIALDKNRSGGPFFDYHYGYPAYVAPIIKKLTGAVGELNGFEAGHEKEFAEYQTVDKAYETATAAYNAAESNLKNLDAEVLNAMKLLSVATEADKANAQKAVDEAKRQRDETKAKYTLALRDALSAQLRLRSQHAKAFGKVAPYLRDLSKIKLQIEELKGIIVITNDIYEKAFTKSQATLLAMETKEVGRASYGYSIWGGELTALKGILKPGYEASALPIFNAQMDSGFRFSETKSATPADGKEKGTTTKTTTPGPAPAELGTDSKDAKVKTPFRDEKGNIIFTVKRELPNEGAGVLRSPVTLGAYCRGDSAMTKAIFEGPAYEGDGDVSFSGYKYVPRATARLSQQVAVNYKYHMKSEPVKVACTLHMKNAETFKKEIESGGFLFWRKSWTKAEHDKVASMGISCDITDKPTHLNDEELTKWLNDTKQTYSQEVLADFLIMNTTHTVSQVEDPKLPEKGWTKTGASMQMLCAGNLYCQITNVVISGIEDLFGSQHGEASNKDTQDITIYRDFSLDSYTVAEGSSLITVDVKIPE